MKQTAVDWLFNRLWETPKDKLSWYSLLEEAKQREKMQIKEAYTEGCYTESWTLRSGEEYHGEEYYKEKYE